jgi:transposase-like protein
MDFPIVDLLDDELSTAWLLKHFHLDGLKCPHCRAGLDQAREFRKTKTSQITVYRCNECNGIYNLYSRTVFEGRYFRPAQAVLLLRGVSKGAPTAEIAREIGVSRQTAHDIRREIQANAQQAQPQTALKDERTETDEMFQNAGEKR